MRFLSTIPCLGIVFLPAANSLADGFVMEAEEMKLKGYKKETSRMYQNGQEEYIANWDKKNPGVATITFREDGWFHFYIGILRENDGQPVLNAYIKKTGSARFEMIDSFRYETGESQRDLEWRSVGVHKLENGDVIKIEGYRDGDACARIDALIFEPVAPPRPNFWVESYAVFGTGCSQHDVDVDVAPAQAGAVISASFSNFAVSTGPSGGDKSKNCWLKIQLANSCPSSAMRIVDVGWSGYVRIGNSQDAFGAANVVYRMNGNYLAGDGESFGGGEVRSFTLRPTRGVSSSSQGPTELEAEGFLSARGPNTRIHMNQGATELAWNVQCDDY